MLAIPFGAAILVRVLAGFESLVEGMKSLWLYPRDRPGELSQIWVTLAYPASEVFGRTLVAVLTGEAK
jgi:hypothetical protein